jgi:hypothetical protein
MPERSDGPSSFENPEAAHGGADAVNDTPTEASHGADIEQPITGEARARVQPGSGVPLLGWVLLVLIVLVVIVFIAGIF